MSKVTHGSKTYKVSCKTCEVSCKTHEPGCTKKLWGQLKKLMRSSVAKFILPSQILTSGNLTFFPRSMVWCVLFMYDVRGACSMYTCWPIGWRHVTVGGVQWIINRILINLDSRRARNTTSTHTQRHVRSRAVDGDGKDIQRRCGRHNGLLRTRMERIRLESVYLPKPPRATCENNEMYNFFLCFFNDDP